MVVPYMARQMHTCSNRVNYLSLCGNDPSGVPQTRILLTCCSGVSYFDGVLIINRLRKSILSCWGLGCGHVQKWPQESCFKHSNDPSGHQMQSLLNGILVINGLRKLIWSCWDFSCGHGQKWPRELHLKHFEDLPWIFAKVVSEAQVNVKLTKCFDTLAT